MCLHYIIIIRIVKNLHLLYKSFLIFVKELLCFEYTILNYIFSTYTASVSIININKYTMLYGCNLYRLLYFMHIYIYVGIVLPANDRQRPIRQKKRV